MKRLLFYSMLIGLTLTAGCKKEKKNPSPEKPKIVQDSTAGYFSFNEEEWVYKSACGEEYNEYYADVLTKAGDTLINHQGQGYLFKRMKVRSIITNDFGADTRVEESLVYFCYDDPNMYKAAWEKGKWIVRTYVVKIDKMYYPNDPVLKTDTINFYGKKFLKTEIKYFSHGTEKFGFIFGISLLPPKENPVYHLRHDRYSTWDHSLQYATGDQAIWIKK